jgi:hypothetical protein
MGSEQSRSLDADIENAIAINTLDEKIARRKWILTYFSIALSCDVPVIDAMRIIKYPVLLCTPYEHNSTENHSYRTQYAYIARPPRKLRCRWSDNVRTPLYVFGPDYKQSKLEYHIKRVSKLSGAVEFVYYYWECVPNSEKIIVVELA